MISDDFCAYVLNSFLAKNPMDVKEHVPDVMTFPLTQQEFSVPVTLSNVKSGLLGDAPLLLEVVRLDGAMFMMINRAMEQSPDIQMSLNILNIKTQNNVAISKFEMRVPVEFNCSLNNVLQKNVQGVLQSFAVRPDEASVDVKINIQRTDNASVINMIDSRYKSEIEILLSNTLTNSMRVALSALNAKRS